MKDLKKEKYRLFFAAGLLVLGGLLLAVPGMRFSAKLSWIAAGLCAADVVFAHLSRKRRFFKICKILLRCGVTAVFILLCGLEGFVIGSGKEKRADLPADAVIVLGAGVNGETPSLALQTRIDRAAEYLMQHEDIPAVLSGGQGPGESVTEAQAMYRALVVAGIAPERLLLEEASRNTKENLINSMELLEKEAGFDTEYGTAAIVTNNFHIARIRVIAGKLFPTTVIGIPAKLPWWWLNVNYYVREAFAMVKTLIF